MNLINQLLQLEGQYTGKGRNHEGQEFRAHLELKPIVDGSGVNIIYTAKDLNNQLLHHENTIIAPNQNQGLSLWTLNSNVPFLYEHIYTSETAKPETAISKYSFKYNTPDEVSKFREEITLTQYNSNEISYNYSWGLPNKEYGPRSEAKLLRNK